LKKRKRRSKKNREFFQTLLFFSTTILSITGLIVYLWVYTEVDETMLAIEVQNQVSIELDNSVNELKMDITQLSRGDRISQVARTELNMIPAQPETLMIYIDKNIITDAN
jgi:cell division protein FtsL|tara:strand:+ start:274 stop:603 length:330 start_codon:yes stop_codon:yes gene_type:complete